MSPNKKTVQKYIDAFNKCDYRQILSCLTDDIIWIRPDAFHLFGKKAVDREIEKDDLISNSTIKVNRLTEEKNIVVAIGTVQIEWKIGGVLNAVFCDVFEMENEKIKRLTTYQLNLDKTGTNNEKSYASSQQGYLFDDF